MPGKQEDDFRQCMRRLAAAVSVISCRAGGVRYGITVTSVTSLSFDPISILCCINRNASIRGPLQQAGCFAVNLLDLSQVDVSKAFGGATPAGNRFDCGAWSETDQGVPFLEGAQANLFCDLDHSHAYATHDIIIGRVTRSRFATAVSPLIYQNGGYHAGSPIPASMA